MPEPPAKCERALGEQDRAQARERLEAEALVERVRGVVAVDDRELDVVGARVERLAAERRGTPAAAKPRRRARGQV